MKQDIEWMEIEKKLTIYVILQVLKRRDPTSLHLKTNKQTKNRSNNLFPYLRSLLKYRLFLF